MKNYLFNSLFIFKFKLEKEGIIRAERDLLNGKIVRFSHFFNNKEEIMKTIRIIKNILC